MSTPNAYKPPEWGAAVPEELYLGIDVMKDGVKIQSFDLKGKAFFSIGRDRNVDIQTWHPSCSRQHCILQFKKPNELFVRDVNSVHGVKLNQERIKMNEFVRVYVGDILEMGQSTRMYVITGAESLEKPESDQEWGDDPFSEKVTRFSTAPTSSSKSTTPKKRPRDKASAESDARRQKRRQLARAQENTVEIGRLTVEKQLITARYEEIRGRILQLEQQNRAHLKSADPLDAFMAKIYKDEDGQGSKEELAILRKELKDVNLRRLKVLKELHAATDLSHELT